MSKRTQFLTLVAFLATCIFSGQNQPLAEQIDQIFEILGKQEFQKTIAAADQLLDQLDPKTQPAEVADLLTAKATALSQIGRTAEAFELHQRALPLRQNHFKNDSLQPIANTLQNLGQLSLELGRLDQAAQFLKKSLQINQKLQSGWQTSVLISLANCERLAGRTAAAEQFLQQAKTFDPLDEADSEAAEIAQILIFLEKKQATAALERLRPLLENLPADQFLKKSNWLKIAAEAEQLAGNFDATNRDFLESLQVLDKIGQPAAARADRLLGWANALLDTGDFETAARQFDAAAALPDLPPTLRAAIFYGIGRVKKYQNQPAAARKILAEASDLLQNQPPENLDPLLPVRIRDLQGSCFLDEKDFGAAEFYFRRALEILAAGNGGRATADGWRSRASLLLKIGHCQNLQGKTAAARPPLDEALQISKRLDDSKLSFAAAYFLGENSILTKNWAAALRFYEQAEAFLGSDSEARAASFPFEFVQILSAQAVAWQKKSAVTSRRDDWQTTLAAAERAIAALENQKTRLHDAASETDWQNFFHEPFAAAVEASLFFEKNEQAFGFAERQKQFFREKIERQARRFEASKNPNSLAARAMKIELEIQRLRRQKLAADAPNGSLDSLIQRLSAAAMVLQDSVRGADFSSNFSSKNWQPPTLAEVRATLREGQSLVEFSWGDEKLVAFVLRADGEFRVHILPVAAAVLPEIAQFFRLCSTPPKWVKPAEQAASAASVSFLAHSIFQKIVAPLAADLSREVVVVPDGALCFLPFCALSEKLEMPAADFSRQGWLVKNYRFEYRNSALLPTARQFSAAENRLNFLAVAPSFGQKISDLEVLENNVGEIEALKKRLGGQILAGEKANERAVVEAAGGARVVHFSTHGVMDDRDPALSFVAFEQHADSLDDGRFYLHEIQNCPLRADLVTLSACETAAGRFVRGEGLASLAGAFQVAGARSVVATFWQVDDLLMRQLMLDFYEKLAAGESKPAALAAAQGQVLARHPFFWASLACFGDGSPLADFGSDSPIWRSGFHSGLCFAVLIFLLFGLRRFFKF